MECQIQFCKLDLGLITAKKSYKAISKDFGLQLITLRAFIHTQRKYVKEFNLPRSGQPSEITPG